MLVLKAQNYFDTAVTFSVGNHYNLRLGVNNILDRQPPLVSQGYTALSLGNEQAAFSNGNTYPGTYDTLGRYIYAGITLNL